MVAGAICARREASWVVLAALAQSDPSAWAAGLEDSLQELRTSTAWLDEQWSPDGLLLLQGLVRRAQRRGMQDLAQLVTDASIAAQPGLGRLRREIRTMHELCGQELAHWRAGDQAAAGAVRVEQMSLLGPASSLRAEAGRLAQARLPVWSPVASLVADYLLLETGR